MKMSKQDHHFGPNRKFRKSLLALSLVSVLHTAYAQEAPETDAEEEEDESVEVIEVKGIRGNLNSAQNLKRMSDTVVDAITKTLARCQTEVSLKPFSACLG